MYIEVIIFLYTYPVHMYVYHHTDNKGPSCHIASIEGTFILEELEINIMYRIPLVCVCYLYLKTFQHYIILNRFFVQELIFITVAIFTGRSCNNNTCIFCAYAVYIHQHTENTLVQNITFSNVYIFHYSKKRNCLHEHDYYICGVYGYLAFLTWPSFLVYFISRSDYCFGEQNVSLNIKICKCLVSN